MWASSNQDAINNYVVSLWFKSNIKKIIDLDLIYRIGKNLTNLHGYMGIGEVLLLCYLRICHFGWL